MSGKADDTSLITNNRGSTFITVIVAISFVTILASIILGTTVMNVRMKGIDKIAKDDFYYAEKTLNDIYTGIGLELAQKAGEQYEESFLKVGTVEDPADPTKDFNMAENAEREFRENFVTYAYTYLSSLDVAALRGFVQNPSKGTVDSRGVVEYQKRTGEHTDSASEAFRVAMKDVKVHCEDATGFQSVIKTDIIINVPTVDFLGTNAEVWDYGLIANEGLYIFGDSWITGNVYAGVHSDRRSALDADFEEDTDKNARGLINMMTGDYEGVFGGINIKDGTAEFKGNYIVSKGDINLSTSSPKVAGTNPHLKVYTPVLSHAPEITATPTPTVSPEPTATPTPTPTPVNDANLANLWFNSIRTIKKADIDPLTTPVPVPPAPLSEPPTIDINANVFALNDMILNADNSSAVLKGNYYGYNDKTVPDVLGQRTGRDDAESSAIIINGSNAYLDMRDINNFVMMGKAYIDFTSDASTNAAAMEAKNQVVPTAESVALKTNQQLYLVPNDFIEGANPAEDSSDTHTFTINIPDADLEKWFGYKYLYTTAPTDPSHPDCGKTTEQLMHKSYKVPLAGSSTNVYYDYLVFNDNVNWKPKVEIDLLTGEPLKDPITHEIQIEKDPVFGTALYEQSTADLGTGGSISSKTKFFYDIMNAKKAYDYAYDNNKDPDAVGRTKEEYIEYKESLQVQPSAYRLYERINRSMGYDYFKLERCVVGNTANMENAHYYARNAVINYDRVSETQIQTNVLNNTDGMLRYSRYPVSLYNRYRWLCTRLDGCEDLLLDQNPGEPPLVGGSSEWVVDTDAPISHFVDLGSIGTMAVTDSINAADVVGLKPGPYGVVIVTDGNLEISSVLPDPAISGKTFKGVAIVDGDITVEEGYNVDGVLMATGTIKLKGNNHIDYDKGLIQSRIEKEMDIIKNDSTSADWASAIAGKDYLLISYLIDPGTGSTLYKVDPGTKAKDNRIKADYNDFIHYENWQKGE